MTEQLFFGIKESEYVNEEVFTGELKLGTKEGGFFYDTRFTAEKIEEIKKQLNYDIEVVRVESEDNQIKTYRKTATIQAERFDGSDGMIERYSIRVEEGFAMKEGEVVSAIVHWLPVSAYPGEPFEMKIVSGDWIVIDNDEYEAMPNDAFKASYVEVAE